MSKLFRSTTETHFRRHLLLVILCWLICFGHSLPAQNQPFKTKTGLEATLIGSGLGTGLLGAYLKNKKSILTIDEINSLNPETIASINRPAINNYSTQAARHSDYIMWGSHALPLLNLIHKDVRKQTGVYGMMYLEAWLLNAGVTVLTKELTKRTRPFVYNPDAPLSRKLEKDARASFFSGHTSVVAVNTFFAAYTFNQYVDVSPYNEIFWGLAVILPAIQGYLRIKAGKHFFTDVVVGYAVGGGIGVLVPWLHQKTRKK